MPEIRSFLPTSGVRLGAPLGLPILLGLMVFGVRPATGQIPRAEIPSPSAESVFDRLWIGVAIGGGGTRLTCDLCQSARDLGPTVDVALGSYARGDLRIGVEAGGWTHDDEEGREKVYRAGVVAYLQPQPDGGAYLTGGFGWSHYQTGDFRYDAPRLTLGAGWDHALGARLRIGNQLTLDAASFGSLRNSEVAVARNVGLSVVRVSIQLYRR